jgi:transposase InsO family protein
MDSKPYKEYDRLVNRNTTTQYRILAIFDGNIITCQIGTPTLSVFYFLESEVEKGIVDGIYNIETDEFQVIDPELYYTNPNPDVRKKQIERFLIYKEVCSTVYDEYKYKLYDLLAHRKIKENVKALCVKHDISKQLFWKYFTRYLQSGLQDVALTDQRRQREISSTKRTISAGMKKQNGDNAYLITDEDRKKFKRHLKRYLKSEVKTKEMAYLDLIEEDYSVIVKTADANGNTMLTKKILPSDQRPTRRQFFYYVWTHSTEQERRESKETKPIIRNNARVFSGTAMDGVRGPGHYVEIDAQEMDIALVSEEYSTIPVGRPILYAAIDVMSQIVLAVSLAMDNNSIVGCTNCMLNLIENKEDLLKRFGIGIDFDDGISIADLWPTGIKPRVVKFDNGSDFISKPIARILKELNIRAEFVSPATGSLKPLVENFFGTIKRDLDDLLEHKGLIRQTYGSKHHAESCLTYDDAYKIVLNAVLYHNSHILASYVKSADMKEKGVVTSPMELWRYGNQVLVPATTFVNRDDALFHMMLPCKDATFSRYGIKRKGLPYFNSSDTELHNRMFLQGSKSTKFECRYDPRDMGHLYYLKDGKIQKASLPSDDYRYQSYFGMSEKRFDELEALSKEKDVLIEEVNTQARISKRRIDKDIIDAASKQHPGKNKVKAMKQARKTEKEFISGENSISNRFDIISESADTISTPAIVGQKSSPSQSVPEETVEQKRLRIMQETAMMDEEDM